MSTLQFFREFPYPLEKFFKWTPPKSLGNFRLLTPLPLGIPIDHPWGGGGVWIFSGTTHNAKSSIFVTVIPTAPGFYVRVVEVYKEPESYQEIVERCPSHITKHKDGEIK